MSISPSGPRDDSYTPEAAATPRWIPIVIVILLLGIAGLGYAAYTSHQEFQQLQSDLATSNSHADVLSKQLDETNSRVAQMRGQLDVTSQKLGLTQDELARARTLAQQIQQQQQDSDAKLASQIGQVQQESDQKIGQVSTDLSGAKTDIVSTQKDLADTKTKLTLATGDISGQGVLIARTRDDLDALRRLGERNIFDFNLTKSKQPQHIGPIQAKLQSTDPKHFKFSLTLIADDKTIEKKDRNVDEPMQFYVAHSRVPYEMVVFEVSKDRVTGYVSTPKDNGPTASAAPAAAPAPGK